MSYIRCLSNPEGMYSWSDEKYVHITSTSNAKAVFCHTKKFVTFIKKVIKNYYALEAEGIRFENMWVREMPLSDKTKPIEKAFQKVFGKYKKDFKIILTIKNVRFEMWYVTWEYFLRNFCKSHNINTRNMG